MRISPEADAALKRAAARKEAELQHLLGDPSKQYGVGSFARAVLESAGRLEIVEHGPLTQEDMGR